MKTKGFIISLACELLVFFHLGYAQENEVRSESLEAPNYYPNNVIAGISVGWDGGVQIPYEQWKDNLVYVKKMNSDRKSPLDILYAFDFGDMKVLASFIEGDYRSINQVKISLVLPQGTEWTAERREALKQAGFVTDHGVVLGDTRAEVRSAYGGPEESQDRSDRYSYFGVVFEYAPTEAEETTERVSAIYVVVPYYITAISTDTWGWVKAHAKGSR